MLNIILSVFLAVLLIREIFALIKKHKNGTYNPLIIDLDNQEKTKMIYYINYFAITFIVYYFAIIKYKPGGIVILIGLVSLIFTVNILNFMYYKKTKNNMIVIQTLILDASFITILYLCSENVIKYLKTITI